MRLKLDELGFFGVFIAFTLYMVFLCPMVDTIIAKLFFLLWMLGVIGFAIYILVKRDNNA